MSTGQRYSSQYENFAKKQNCEPFGSDFKTILKGSSFCTFGRVMYKTKTPVKFVDNRKSLCSLFLLRSRIMCERFVSDFKTILKGLRFVPLVGLCTKRRPRSDSLKTAYFVVPCFENHV